MNLNRALHYRLKTLRRRVGPRLALGSIAWILAIILLIAGLVAAGQALASGGPVTADSVSDTVFWIGILQALLYCYTTFEFIYRAPDQRFLGALPVKGGPRYDELMVVALVAHLPLLLIPLAYAYGVYESGQTELAAFAILYPTISLLTGVPIAMALHLLAGKSLLAGGSALKKMLAGAVVADEAAMLIYAPALGLLIVAVLGLFLEVALKLALARHDTGTVIGLAIGAGVVMGFAWRAGRKVAAEALHRILPRFSEADVPPPFRDDGVARHLPGASLARFLPTTARPYFMRDLRQLRRRFRLDRLLLWVTPLLGWKVAADAGDAWLVLVAVVAVFVVVAFTSGFRLVGKELSAPALDQALPLAPRDLTIGRLAASVLHPLQAALGFAAGVAIAGHFTTALVVAALGATFGAIWTAVVYFLTRHMEADFVGSWAIVTRLVAIAGFAWLAS